MTIEVHQSPNGKIFCSPHCSYDGEGIPCALSLEMINAWGFNLWLLEGFDNALFEEQYGVPFNKPKTMQFAKNQEAVKDNG